MKCSVLDVTDIGTRSPGRKSGTYESASHLCEPDYVAAINRYDAGNRLRCGYVKLGKSVRFGLLSYCAFNFRSSASNVGQVLADNDTDFVRRLLGKPDISL